jgi:hypothetical protein
VAQIVVITTHEVQAQALAVEPYQQDSGLSIQIEFRQVQVVPDGQNDRLSHAFQAAVRPPLAEMIVNGTIADLFTKARSLIL